MASSVSTPARSSRYLALVMSAALLWGTVGVTTQALYHLSATNPFSIGFFRLAIAAPLLMLACVFTLRRHAWQIARRDVGLMALIGAMLALYQACFFAAIARIGVTVATLVTLCLAPVLVACLAPLWTRERLTPRIALALLAALAGIACVVVGGPGVGGVLRLNDALGVVLACGSALGYAIVTLAGRTLAPKYHALQINAVGFTTGAMLLLCLALATGFVVSYPPQGWLLLGYPGVVPTALAYALSLTACERPLRP